MTSPAPVVAVEGVAKTYADGTRALAPVDLAIAGGEFVTLLGPSGCGKTTLLRMVAGLSAPTQGRIAWWGAPAPPADDPARRLAMVFQSPTLMPWASVAANARLPLDLAGTPRADAERVAIEALAGVGLAGTERKFPRELSGGMQMRVAIARALANAPALLLMDEPFGALDEFTRHRLDADLAALWHSRSLSVLFVTHSIQEAVFLSTRVVVMAAKPGRVVADVAIPAPHPRGAAFRGSAQFAALCAELSSRVADAATAQA
ncbi:MAG: ABC transporter ATP-binding protein [Burkholderiales bacterium]